MPNYEIPTEKDVMDFGSEHNPAVWNKHRARLSNPSDLDAVLERCRANTKLSRRHVFAMAETKSEWGVIAAVIWGFPRGSMPGGKWEAFADAFEGSTQFASELAGLRANPAPGTVAIEKLNRLVKGLNFATTTKIAYFARLDFREGPALIYDKNVIDAIVSSATSMADRFPRTKFLLRSSNSYSNVVSSYGSYVEEASALAKLHDTTPDAIEVALFRSAVRPGTWA